MRIVCERCGAPFAVDETRVPEKGARAACPKCKNIVVLRRPAQPTTLPPDPLAPQLDTPTHFSQPDLNSATTAPPLPPDPLQRDGRMTGEYAVPDALSAAIASAIGRVTGTFPPAQQPGNPPDRLEEALGLSPTPTPAVPLSFPTPMVSPAQTLPPFIPPEFTNPHFIPPPTAAFGQPVPDATPVFGVAFPSAPTPIFGTPAAGPNTISSPDFQLEDLFAHGGSAVMAPTPAYVAPITSPPVYVPPGPTPAPIPYSAPVRQPSVPVPFMPMAPAPNPAPMPYTPAASAPVPPPFPAPTPRPPEEVMNTGEISAAFLVTGTNPLSDSTGNHPMLDPSGPLLSGPGDADEWRLKKAEGVVEGPFTAQELLARFEAGLIQPTDLVAQGNDSFRPLTSYPLTAGFAKGKAVSGRAIKAFASTDRGPFPWRSVLAVMAAVTGVMAGAFLIATRPSWLFAPPVSPADASALAIIESWREKAPAHMASAHELYQLARGYYAADTRESYRLAAETYKLVIIKQPSDLKAMSGFAEVEGILAVEDGNAVGVQESAELLSYALRHGDDLAAPHVARANLLAATGTASDLLVAQSEASRARRISPDDADVLLAVGRAFLQTNAEYALEALEKAQKLDPKLRQLPVLLGQTYLRIGRIADARAAFEQRKKLVPEDANADIMLAELDASIGRFDRARQRLAAAGRENPKSIDARLMATEFLYQIDGKLKEAREELKALQALPLDRKHKLRVLIHAAAVAQQLGLMDEADSLIKAGQELDSESAPLLFRLTLVRLAQGRAEEALKLFERIETQIPDTVERQLLAGRIRAAMGQIDIAQGRFSKAIDYSPYDSTGYLLEAAMYAQVGAEGQALTYIRKGLNADPAWSQSHRTVSDFYDGQNALYVAVGAFESLLSGQDEIALTEAALAMARYHIGDAEGAEHAAQLALKSEDGALAAHVYLAQLHLDRHEPQAAQQELDDAWSTERHCPTVPYLAGRALAQLGRYDEAHAKFQQALDIDINFLPARVRDAEVLAQMGQKDQALKLYQKAFESDPEDLDVRRGLDAIEQGELPPSMDVAIEVQNDPEAP